MKKTPASHKKTPLPHDKKDAGSTRSKKTSAPNDKKKRDFNSIHPKTADS